MARLTPLGEFDGRAGKLVDIAGDTPLPGLIDGNIDPVAPAIPAGRTVSVRGGRALARSQRNNVTTECLGHAS